MAPKNPFKIWRQIFLTNANLNGLAIDNNQSRTSIEHFDPPLFQILRKIIFKIVQDFNNQTKVIIFSKSRSAIRAEPVLSLYGDLLSYYPHIRFLGITFDNRMTFTKHFEEILERCNQKFHRLRILVNKKWGPSPETILQIYKQCVRPIFEYGIVSTITVSETVITKMQRVQNSFM